MIDPESTEPVATIQLSVNGAARTGTAPVRMTLGDFLRDVLRLTGTHLGCEHGVCGACTVIMDGVAVRSCLIFAVQAAGHSIETVEGLAAGGALDELQSALSRHHALQCGFCTPGFLMTASAALRDGPIPDENTARAVLSGNICRCTGYRGLIDALVEVGRP